MSCFISLESPLAYIDFSEFNTFTSTTNIHLKSNQDNEKTSQFDIIEERVYFQPNHPTYDDSFELESLHSGDVSEFGDSSDDENISNSSIDEVRSIQSESRYNNNSTSNLRIPVAGSLVDVQRRTIDILVKNLEAAEAELDAQDTRLKLQLREKALSSMKSKSDRELDVLYQELIQSLPDTIQETVKEDYKDFAAIQSHFTDPFFLRIVRHLPSASLEKVVLSHFKTLNQLSGDKGDILISLLEFANAYIKFNSTSKQLKSLVDERNEVNLECHQLFRDGLSFANIERKGWSERDIKKVLDKIVNDRKV